MSVYLQLSSLVYKELQPMAKVAGCQLAVFSQQTYKPWTDALHKKMVALGIDLDQYEELNDAIQQHGCIAILKRKKYYGPIEIAHFFSKVGLQEQDVHVLASVNAKEHPVWGDFDMSIPKEKAMFFYWFAVDVEQ